MRQDNIQKGSKAEGLFYAKCLELNKNVCIPLMPTQFDCIVVSGGKLKRVQVKSVSGIDKSSRGEKVKCMLTSWRKGRRGYNKSDTDFIALLVSPIKEWYIFPIKEVENKLTISLFPTVKDSESKYEKYRGRFDLI